MIQVRQSSAEIASRPGVGLPRVFARYLVLIAVLFTLSMLSLLRVHLQGRPLKYAHLWTEPKDIYGDFWHYRALLQQLHRPEFFSAADRFAYPAPCAIVLQLLYHSGAHPHVSFNLLLWTVELLSAIALCRILVRHGVRLWVAVGSAVLMVVSSFPWFILYIRGNLEVFVYAAVALGVWAWARSRYPLAAVCWGLAASFKIYPFLLLWLFVKRTHWRAFAVGVLTFVGSLLAAFLYVGPTVRMAALGTLNGILGFSGSYAVHARRDELWLDHSILGAAKEILSFPLLHFGASWTGLNHLYYAVLLVALPWLYFRYFRSLPEANQLCLLLIGMMLLPPVSYDYTLIYTYLALGIVLVSALQQPGWDSAPSHLGTLFVCFGVLSSSESWLRPAGLEFNSILKCAALITSAVVLFRVPLKMGTPMGSDAIHEGAVQRGQSPACPFSPPNISGTTAS